MTLGRLVVHVGNEQLTAVLDESEVHRSTQADPEETIVALIDRIRPGEAVVAHPASWPATRIDALTQHVTTAGLIVPSLVPSVLAVARTVIAELPRRRAVAVVVVDGPVAEVAVIARRHGELRILGVPGSVRAGGTQQARLRVVAQLLDTISGNDTMARAHVLGDDALAAEVRLALRVVPVIPIEQDLESAVLKGVDPLANGRAARWWRPAR